MRVEGDAFDACGCKLRCESFEQRRSRAACDMTFGVVHPDDTRAARQSGFDLRLQLRRIARQVLGSFRAQVSPRVEKSDLTCEPAWEGAQIRFEAVLGE